MARTHSLIAIDPGLNSMGWAYWKRTVVISGTRRVVQLGGQGNIPTRTGLLKAPRSLELTDRARWLAHALAGELRVEMTLFEFEMVSEFPAWHGGSLGWAAGDLQKLVFLVGVLAGYFSQNRFTPVTPGEWKGQLPKAVVIRRLQKRFGPGATQEWEKDIWDAVGIGLWKLGKF